jgi:hypothetical protein
VPCGDSNRVHEQRRAKLRRTMGQEGSIPSGGAQNQTNFGNESVGQRHHDGGSGGSPLWFLCSREGWTRARTAGRECGGDVCTLLSDERGARRSHDAELVGAGKAVA